MDKAEFVQKCGELLHISKPHMVRCDYFLGKDISPKSTDYFDNDEYVIVTCENGCRYILIVTGNSLSSIAAEIFSQMTYK